jgi:hypothetical protein
MDSKPKQDMAAAPAAAAPPPPSVYLLVQNPVVTSDEDHFKKTFPARTVNILAIIQIVSCFLSIISHIVVLCFVGPYYMGIELSFAGVWCGVFFGVSGFIGCLAARHPSSGRIVGFMVMSVISSCFCLPLLILPAIGIVNSEDTRMIRSRFSHMRDLQYTHDWLLALNVIEIFLALITAIVTIISSAYSCRAVCCRKTKGQGTVFYYPAGLQGLQGLPVTCQSVPLLAGSGDASLNAYTQADESVVDAEAGHYQRLL